MKKEVDFKELFKTTVENASDVKKEFDRLGKIEEKLLDYMNERIEEAEGLNKSRSYSSVSYSAKLIIEDKENSIKKEINKYCDILDIYKKYDNLK